MADDCTVSVGTDAGSIVNSGKAWRIVLAARAIARARPCCEMRRATLPIVSRSTAAAIGTSAVRLATNEGRSTFVAGTSCCVIRGDDDGYDSPTNCQGRFNNEMPTTNAVTAPRPPQPQRAKERFSCLASYATVSVASNSAGARACIYAARAAVHTRGASSEGVFVAAFRPSPNVISTSSFLLIPLSQ